MSAENPGDSNARLTADLLRILQKVNRKPYRNEWAWEALMFIEKELAKVPQNTGALQCAGMTKPQWHRPKPTRCQHHAIFGSKFCKKHNHATTNQKEQ